MKMEYVIKNKYRTYKNELYVGEIRERYRAFRFCLLTKLHNGLQFHNI